MGRLDGKVAIVTGAARGTGAATARALVAAGAKVVLGDLLDDLGEAVAKELGDAARYLHMDITREQDWSRAIDSAHDFGPLGVLVNNAAILHIAPIEQTSAEDYLRVVTVNELGTFLGVRSAIEPMRAAGGGSIINISSIDGWYAAPGTSAYSASKFAVRGITKVAALELGRYGIRVNSLNPAAGSSEMVEPFLSPEAMRARQRDRAREVPLGRGGRVEDVAQAVVFLASDESSFFHGADLALDGGITAGMVIPGPIPGERR
ncbi:MAG: glucose 1-dehydrogenase [Myxococcota bacterium]|nr:glucose 1-dehydrogenase [Myxococcota bacterium]